jgi:hypothetical protein
MIRMQTAGAAQPARRPNRKDTFQGFVTDFIVPDEHAPVRAQAFLVDQDPNWVTPPHFHLEHQFQIVVAGAGAIGRHDVRPFAIHYASPETGYGPITAGPEGISYLTLRAVGDTGAWYLHKPEQRSRMRRGLKKQQAHGAPAAAISEAELQTLAAPSIEALIAPQASGLAAHLVRLPPNRALALPADHAHGGRFYVATRGSIRVAGADLPALATVFASADETPALESGSGGAEALVLQFPRQAIQQEPST